MNFENQIIFFFSALGSFNGFLLSFYFALNAKKKKFSNYFLSLLLLVLSIRIIKSVFFYFSPNLSVLFVQIGLSACILIGPYLYLYIKSQTKENEKNPWIIHTIPFLIAITIVGIIYPYWSHRALWSKFFVSLIYLQWFIYIIFSGIELKNILKKLFNRKEKLNDIEIWLISIFTGTTFIWFAYNIGSFTSYIVGALSFSFILYLLILLWAFKKNKNTLFFEAKEKYGNKKIDIEKIKSISKNLTVIKDRALFKNPDLKLSDVAKELNVLPHTLSQYLNDNLNKSFSLFINEFRIEEAKSLLISDNNYTIEAIGYDSGFNSKSTFFTSFKKITGITPSKYREQNK